MAATVIINELNGAGSTATNKTSSEIQFKKADNALVDGINPMVVPTSGNACSWEKWLRLEFTTAPATQITNINAYSDGASGFGSGVSCYYKVATAFTQPIDIVDSAARISASITSDLFAATSSSPIDMDATVNTGPHTGTGAKANWLVLCMQVDSTAVQGVISGESITFSYDES